MYTSQQRAELVQLEIRNTEIQGAPVDRAEIERYVDSIVAWDLARHIKNARLAIDASDKWVPACGGSEQPFKSRSGITLLYCWNPAQGKHAYLNVDIDIIMSDEEAQAALGNV